ncbi:MAG: tRNA (guanosine(37)-N1)-methyltransferase TrmD [Acidocella sp. 20-57-95]|nr:MAG: tRNA (guanosine(37)-N1)-methyltransferase TrmD [Acidocella sp. 20-57-95]OYV62241.1 MAG: tRNA (guanosine(37)-N1)-methyltransferase TrmD [Acidocella sp. 21-58-7]HQT62966.1 tRNA (guanosine(37)-N1)-methyltransferase TrmD [Acidocella sp.]
MNGHQEDARLREHDGLGREHDGLGHGPDGLGREHDGLGRGRDGLGYGPDELGRRPDGAAWRADVLTIFPSMFPGPLGESLAGKALASGIWNLTATDIRDFGLGRHRSVDDTPFGGGAGMVMRPDVLDAAIASVADERPLIVLTPRGVPLTQKRVAELSAGPGVILLCGRFEGIDQRVIEARNAEEISIGDYILSGGEIAALALLDAAVRLLPGVMGAMESADEESFSSPLLEYPHYTRPAVWADRAVPETLTSGNHQAIAAWRRDQAKNLTKIRRPDLYNQFVASGAQAP